MKARGKCGTHLQEPERRPVRPPPVKGDPHGRTGPGFLPDCLAEDGERVPVPGSPSLSDKNGMTTGAL
ncbi:hypothetical protein KKI24_17895 [bacterium]|nr:hypothetical protein [bacterium]